MVSRRNNKRQGDSKPIVIAAPTLKEAYRLIKRDFGKDAVILGSRSVTTRQSLGLGHEKSVEVTVQAPLNSEAARSLVNQYQSDNSGMGATPADLPAEVAKEVSRIEELVKAISLKHDDMNQQRAIFQQNPLAESLLEAGVTSGTIEKLITRFSSETGQEVTNRMAALTWLTDNLKASNCDWDGFYGCHAFIGQPGSGRTSLVYEAAARLQTAKRRTLVLSVMPEDKGGIRKLQSEASRSGFDAAVISQESQLASSTEHLAKYEAVLLDLPAMNRAIMAPHQALHNWLADNSSFHRHLVVPLDADPQDVSDLATLVRHWHMDWLAVSRCDLTKRQGKILDFCDAIPLPYSLVSERKETGQSLDIAKSGALMDRILGHDQNSMTVNGFEAGA